MQLGPCSLLHFLAYFRIGKFEKEGPTRESVGWVRCAVGQQICVKLWGPAGDRSRAVPGLIAGRWRLRVGAAGGTALELYGASSFVAIERRIEVVLPNSLNTRSIGRLRDVNGYVRRLWSISAGIIVFVARII